MKFTGKERDQETGLDYFGAPYFASGQGRFGSADEPFADWDQKDPQSWSLYSYVRNNPLRFTDPTGQACTVDWKDDGRGGSSCAEVREQDKQLRPSITVGVGQDEANLVMLQGIGQKLSSPYQWATVISGAGQAAMSIVSPLSTAFMQCAMGNCSNTNLAMAMLPMGAGKITRWGWAGTTKFLSAVRMLVSDHQKTYFFELLPRLTSRGSMGNESIQRLCRPQMIHLRPV